MIIRYPLTVFTLAAILMASGAAFAGGMPSDEGPEVLLDELGFDNEFDRGAELDQGTITAIIKSQMPQELPAAFIPAAYVTAAIAVDAPAGSTPKLPPALNNPEGFLPRDHR